MGLLCKTSPSPPMFSTNCQSNGLKCEFTIIDFNSDICDNCAASIKIEATIILVGWFKWLLSR